MNRQHFLSVSAVAALGLALLPSSAVGQQKSLKDQLVGTWTLVSWEQTNADGSKLQRFGANPKGVNVFDANGRVFVMFARPDLPKIASGNPSTPTPEEGKAIVGGAIGYFGTYTVNEADKSVAFRLEASSFPNLLLADQKRTIVSVTADELKYSNPVPITGGQINYVFRRAN
jgi:Lipocalin-like domain